MNRPANVHFLTEQENECLELLLQAQDIFDKICEESPQSPTDSYNFGHYLDAARSAILLRGARRLDEDNLLSKHRMTNTLLDQDKKNHQKVSPEKKAIDADPLVMPSQGIVPNTPGVPVKDFHTAICKTIPELLENIYTVLRMS